MGEGTVVLDADGAESAGVKEGRGVWIKVEGLDELEKVVMGGMMDERVYEYVCRCCFFNICRWDAMQ